jgi:5'(3')-deoxyribonucleotidase
MKLFELESIEQKTPPIVYIDMDGVLADMFGQVAKYHGVKHWRKARKVGKVQQVAKRPGFFRRLKPLPEAGKIIMGVLKAVGAYSILSSPMLSRVEQSSSEKSEWLQHHLAKHQPTSILFDHNKEKYARQSNGTPNILIDDFETNIKLWRARGGIGILYEPNGAEQVLRDLDLALRGHTHTGVVPTEQASIDSESAKKYYTSRDVLKYVHGVHREYHLEDPILKFKVWQLALVPISQLNTPEKYDQDDRYKRLIDLEWEHIDKIDTKDINKKPIVIDDRGWILDGNHRAVAARVRGMKTIPAYLPVVNKQIND